MRKMAVGVVLGMALCILEGNPVSAQDRPLTADDIAALPGAGSTPAEVGQLVKQRGYRGGVEPDAIRQLKAVREMGGLEGNQPRSHAKDSNTMVHVPLRFDQAPVTVGIER